MPGIFQTATGQHATIINGSRVEGGLVYVQQAIKDAESDTSLLEEKQEPRCPQCGRVRAVKEFFDMFRCSSCGAEFDDDPDEGGDYLSDPTKRIERKRRRRRSA